jgi:hypothetical protein
MYNSLWVLGKKLFNDLMFWTSKIGQTGHDPLKRTY